MFFLYVIFALQRKVIDITKSLKSYYINVTYLQCLFECSLKRFVAFLIGVSYNQIELKNLQMLLK
jgi:hypothetical protein